MADICGERTPILVLYASSHGKTRRVATSIARSIDHAPTLRCVTDLQSPQELLNHDVIVICCPNYGDGEVQADMEDFLQTLDLDLHNQRIAICELGNYFGYGDFSFGAMNIIRQEFLSRGATELTVPLSLDSVPRMSEAQLGRWINVLQRALEGSRV